MSKFQNWRIITLIFIMCASSFLASSSADPFLLPKVAAGSEPVIDGNMTTADTEWQESAKFNTTIGGNIATIYVTSDNDSLYVGLNYTSAEFIPVNSTSYNSTSSQNLDAHDWLALQFDNNLDKAELGTSSSPDDVIIVNQFNSSIQDGYMDGNSTSPFMIDTLNNGTSDGDFAFMNDTNDLGYEFMKPFTGSDINGSDITASNGIFQFRFNSLFNQTSNSTNFQSSQWFTLRINENGTGVAVKSISEVTINLSIVGGQSSDFDAIQTVFDQYGFDLDVNTGSLVIGDHDLTIVILQDGLGLSELEKDSLISYIELGGKVILSLPSDGNATSLYGDFGLDHAANSVLQDDNSTSLTLSRSNINTDISFLSGDSTYTNRSVDEIQFSGSAMNMSSIMNSTLTPFVLRQEFSFVKLFSGTNLVYDTNGDGIIDADEAFSEDLTMGVRFNFLKGGRMSVFSSSSIFSDEFLGSSDNIQFLLRLIPWNSKIIDTIQINSVTLSSHAVNESDVITITVNATNGFGDVIDGITITADLLRSTEIEITVTFVRSGDVYTAEMPVNSTGTLSIVTRAFLEGYGFAEGDAQQIFSEFSVQSFNDLGEINILVSIIFVLSITLGLLTYMRSKSN